MVASTPLAQAESIDSAGFHYFPGPLAILHGASGYDAPVLGWNVNDHRMLAPGMKINFWGGARGCDPGARNGPLAESTVFAPEQLAQLVGLVARPGQHPYSPSGHFEQCAAGAQSAEGPTFALVDESGDGGIALYTQSSTAGGSDFLGPFIKDAGDTKIAHGNGNDHNQGAFVTFRFDWRNAGPAVLTPWGGGDVHAAGSAQIRSLQTVQVLDAGVAPAHGSEKAVTQAKQELVITFINRACAATEKTPTRPCQLQYVFNTAIVRSNVPDWSRYRRSQVARVMFDKAQGGLPVIFGPVKGAGESTEYEDQPELTLWTSRCDPTQHVPVRDLHTCVEIRRQDLLTAMRIAAAKMDDTSPASITDAQLADRFGSRWADTGEWHLGVVSFGQEVFNALDGVTPRIGGNLRQLEIVRGN